MATGSVTVTDQASGVETATTTVTEDAVTKHIQRVQIDNRVTGPVRRYSASLTPSGGITAVTTINTNLCGIMAGTSTVYIKRVLTYQYNLVAGTLVPLAMRRCTTLAGGTLVTASTVPEHVQANVVSDAVIRYGTGVTNASEGIPMWYFIPQGTIGAINTAGVSAEWKADTIDDSIVLVTGEALIWEVDIASDTDNRYHVLLSWEVA
jgi:hypothetical protein